MQPRRRAACSVNGCAALLPASRRSPRREPNPRRKRPMRRPTPARRAARLPPRCASRGSSAIHKPRTGLVGASACRHPDGPRRRRRPSTHAQAWHPRRSTRWRRNRSRRVGRWCTRPSLPRRSARHCSPRVFSTSRTGSDPSPRRVRRQSFAAPPGPRSSTSPAAAKTWRRSLRSCPSGPQASARGRRARSRSSSVGPFFVRIHACR
jgi:hypothetical protein